MRGVRVRVRGVRVRVRGVRVRVRGVRVRVGHSGMVMSRRGLRTQLLDREERTERLRELIKNRGRAESAYESMTLEQMEDGDQ